MYCKPLKKQLFYNKNYTVTNRYLYTFAKNIEKKRIS